jgi:hypothetical protein
MSPKRYCSSETLHARGQQSFIMIFIDFLQLLEGNIRQVSCIDASESVHLFLKTSFLESLAKPTAWPFQTSPNFFLSSLVLHPRRFKLHLLLFLYFSAGRKSQFHLFEHFKTVASKMEGTMDEFFLRNTHFVLLGIWEHDFIEKSRGSRYSREVWALKGRVFKRKSSEEHCLTVGCFERLQTSDCHLGGVRIRPSRRRSPSTVGFMFETNQKNAFYSSCRTALSAFKSSLHNKIQNLHHVSRAKA